MKVFTIFFLKKEFGYQLFAALLKDIIVLVYLQKEGKKTNNNATILTCLKMSKTNKKVYKNNMLCKH